MQLYLNGRKQSEEPTLVELEVALATVRAAPGTGRLCLRNAEGHTLGVAALSQGFGVEHIRGICRARLTTPNWRVVCESARRFLSGELPIPGAITEDGCPICRLKR